MRSVKKTPFMRWIDAQLEADPELAREVDELISEMKIKQELVALRERRGLSQRKLAKLLGTSQPYVAKLESGKIQNLGIKTLIRCATALGGSVTLKIEPRKRVTAMTGRQSVSPAKRARQGRPGRTRKVASSRRG